MWFLRDEWLFMQELPHVITDFEYSILTPEDQQFYFWQDEEE